MSSISVKSLTSQGINEFIDSFDTVLTDCDGVLWHGNTAIPQSPEALNAFRKLGKRVFYVTNNSTKTREEFAVKCDKLNFQATKEEILCTSYLAACFLKKRSFNKKVYVVGTTGITKELDLVGISHTEVGPDIYPESGLTKLLAEKDPEVGAVIVGFDEHFSYVKMAKAALYLADKNVLFVATNTDERYPIADDILMPGSGCLVRCIETASRRKANVMGKPESFVGEVIKDKYNVDPKRTLMIGDKGNTDILLGTRCGFKTLLVLSGDTKIEDVEQWKESSEKEEQDLVPNFYIDKLGDLLPHLQKRINEKS